MKAAILTDLTRCVGCGACVLACKQANGLPLDEGGEKLSASSFTVIDRRAGIPYPEWNMWTGSFLADHVAVLERRAPKADKPSPPVSASLRRWFEEHTHRTMKNRLEDGADLDIDQYIEHHVNRVTGTESAARVFRDLKPAGRDVTTAPPEIVTDAVPLSPTTNRPVFATADVAFTVVPAPVISPLPVDPAAPPKNTFPPGTVRSAPLDRLNAAVCPDVVPTTSAPVAASMPPAARDSVPAVNPIVPDAIRR